MAKSTDEICLVLKETGNIENILNPSMESLKVRDAATIELENEVTYLTKQVSEIEQFSSTFCVIVRNLPLLSGRSILEDVVTFINKQLGVQMGPKDLLACHALSLVNPAQPPAVTIFPKFIYSSLKYRE